MKRFVFKLERVLDYRRQLEEQARLELAKVLHQREELRARVADLQARITQQEQELAQAKSLTAADLWLWRTYRERLGSELEQAQFEVARIEIEVERCRKQAVERSKERKLLEKLKTNQAVRHAREQLLAEQKEYDEMATLRHQPQAV